VEEEEKIMAPYLINMEGGRGRKNYGALFDKYHELKRKKPRCLI